MTIIKKGYRVTVKTWENDADNYKSGSIEGLSHQEAAFLVDFVKLFSSQNDRRNRGIGNMYDPSEAEREKAFERVKKVVEKHRTAVENNEEIKQYFFDEDVYFFEDVWAEYAYELTLSGGVFYTRVMDSYKVEFIPQDIVLEDVTGEFV